MNYFAYGSNMNMGRMDERTPYGPVPVPAILHDYILVINKQASGREGVGYANIVRSKGDHVIGVVYAIKNFNDLDRHEGYPVHYNRKKVTLESMDDGILEAQTYIATPEWTRAGLKSTKDYMAHLIMGAEDFCFPDAYIAMLRKIKTMKDRGSRFDGPRRKKDVRHMTDEELAEEQRKSPMSDKELERELDADRLAEIMDELVLLRREQSVDAGKMAMFQKSDPKQYRIHQTSYFRREEKIKALQAEYVTMRMKNTR